MAAATETYGLLSRRGPFLRLLAYARPYVAALVAAVASAGVFSAAETGRIAILKPLIDDVIVPVGGTSIGFDGLIAALKGEALAPGHDAITTQQREQAVARVRAFLPALALALGLTFVIPLATFGQEYLSQYLLGRILVDIQRDLCVKLLSLPLSYHHHHARGETLSRIMNDTGKANTALDQFFVDILQAVVMLVVIVSAMLLLSWQLTIALGVLTPLLVGAVAHFGMRIQRRAARRQAAQADMTQRQLQILAGIKIVKAFQAQEGEAQGFATENLRYFRRNMKVMKNRSGSRAAVELISNLIAIAVLLLGVSMVLGGAISVGTVIAYVVMMSRAYKPTRDLSRAWARLQEAIPSAARFFEVLDATEEPPDVTNALAIPGVRSGISLRNVSFAYDEERGAVLRDVSLDVKAGEMVAIVGKTGSGKTTLADLLLRLYDPVAGAIEIDGVDLRRLQRKSWLDHVAVVTQDPFLFAGTIRENILYGRPSASEEEMLAAARAAHVDEFVARFAAGYDTDVGEAGTAISGGQRQRITIARAILKKPDVLIFDEAMSALDTVSEKLVQEAIDSLLEGRTTFVIAHRLSTVRHASKIVVLSGGRIVEAGTHEELMARGGAYADLMRAQEFSA